MRVLWHHGSGIGGNANQVNPPSAAPQVSNSFEYLKDKKITILLMDDEHAFRSVMAEYFEEEGFKVIQAIDGEDALNKLAGEKVVIIISDTINKLGMGGPEFAKKRPVEIPFILISNHFPEGLNEANLNLSARIDKGSMEELLKTVQRLTKDKVLQTN